MNECGYASDLVVCQFINAWPSRFPRSSFSLFPRSSQLPNFAPYLPIFPLTACEPGSQARKQSGPLPVCGKIFERVVHSRAVNFLVKKKSFNPSAYHYSRNPCMASFNIEGVWGSAPPVPPPAPPMAPDSPLRFHAHFNFMMRMNKYS